MAKTAVKTARKTKAANGATQRRAPKPAAPTFDVRSLPGPETILRRVLPNGIVVLVRENHTSPAVVLVIHGTSEAT